jgi:putative ABC transport system substrate-binding protein
MSICLPRREFVVALGSAMAWSLAAAAQQRAVPVIGFLQAGSPEAYTHYVEAFRKGLSQMGFVEGRNVAIEFRWAYNQNDRLPELAAGLVRRRVAVIAAFGDPAALAVKASTPTIPIVFAGGRDPVQSGLVARFNRPGGNITGYTGISVELVGKQLGLLRELLPRAVRFAALVNPASPEAEYTITNLKTAALAIGGQLEVLTATTNREIDAAYATLAQNRAEGLVVGSDALFITRRVQLATLAVKYMVPAISSFREDVEAGLLMSYGSSIMDGHRQAGVYVGRILKGEKPAEMPVFQAVKYEFVINLQTARTLGVEVPPALQAIADELVE